MRQILAALALITLLPLAAKADVVEIAAPDGADIQTALNQCPDSLGCVVRLQGALYKLPNSLFLRGKRNIRLTGGGATTKPVILFQDDGSLAGPDTDPDTLKLKPKGWKHWPISSDTLEGGTGNRSNRYSLAGSQNNGVVVLRFCRNIQFDSLVIDGQAPIGWGSRAVWSGLFDVFLGNIGLNLTYSMNVTVRDCEVRHCFAGIYVHGVAYDDTASGLSALRPYCGGHLFERNSIHHNIWAAYKEANFGSGLVWRYNKIWENHNSSETFKRWYSGDSAPMYDRTNFTGVPKFSSNQQSIFQAGGFMMLKDSSVLDSVYNNTFWKNYLIVGFDGWRKARFAFYNNLVSSPWFDYNKDTTGFVSWNFVANYGYFWDLFGASLKSIADSVVRSNTLSLFPLLSVYGSNPKMLSPSGCTGTREVCQHLADSLRGVVWDVKKRFHPTTITYQNQPYVIGLSYQGLQYVADNSNLVYWKFEAPSETGLPRVTRSGIGSVLDSAGVISRFGILDGSPAKDTVGRILKLSSGTSISMADSALFNHYIKSIPLVTDTASPYFLSPIWADKGVDSVIRGKAWAPAGQIPPTARGAVMPEDVPQQGDAVFHSAIRSAWRVVLGADGRLSFPSGTSDGTCQILSVDGRVSGVLDLKSASSSLLPTQRGLLVMRWKHGAAWRLASVFRP